MDGNESEFALRRGVVRHDGDEPPEALLARR
jgi:hypothetical protein